MSRPTSLRLTPAQEAELAALAEALPGRRPDLAAALPAGGVTPGGVLRLALARGLRELRAELDGEPEAPPAPLAAPPATSPPPTPEPGQPEGLAAGLAVLRAEVVEVLRAELAELRLGAAPPTAPAAAPPRPETPPGWRLAVHGEGRAEVLLWRTAGRVGLAWPAGRWSCADLPSRAAPVPGRLAMERCPEPELVAAAAAAAWADLGRAVPPADGGPAPLLALVPPPPAPPPLDPPEAIVLRGRGPRGPEVDARAWREPVHPGEPLRLGLAWPRARWVARVGPLPCVCPSPRWLYDAGLVKADAEALGAVLAEVWEDLIAWSDPD